LVILRKQTAGLSDTTLERFIVRAKRAIGLRGVVNILVTSSRELRILNNRYRGQDKATDVLSFPPLFGFEDFVGDIAISAEIAAQNARRFGHSAAEEIKILALHGILHLAGFDHESDHGRMARKEARLRRQLKLPGGLIARNSEDRVLKSTGKVRGPRQSSRRRQKSNRRRSNPPRISVPSRGLP
jgi:probable rRNA maturation factor